MHHLLSVESKWTFVYIFFATTIANNLFDNHALLKIIDFFSYWYHDAIILYVIIIDDVIIDAKAFVNTLL